MRLFLSSLREWIGTPRSGTSSRTAPTRARLGVESLDERVLPSGFYNTMSTNPYFYDLQADNSLAYAYQPPTAYLQQWVYYGGHTMTPNLAGQSVVLKDSSGTLQGTLVVQMENSDGTFTGTFNGRAVDPGATITATGISFTQGWAENTGLFDSTGVPLVQVHWFEYSGSLSMSGSHYTTSGTLTQDTYFGYQSGGVTTFVNIFGGHHWQSTWVSGDFA
jgi:hypothetical protein